MEVAEFCWVMRTLELAEVKKIVESKFGNRTISQNPTKPYCLPRNA